MATRQESVDALKHTLENYGSDFLMGWLATHAPWTQLPILNFIFKGIAHKIMGDFVDLGELAIFIPYIDFRVDRQGIDLEDAMIKNYRAQMNPNASQEEKNATEQTLKERFANFAVLTSH